MVCISALYEAMLPMVRSMCVPLIEPLLLGIHPANQCFDVVFEYCQLLCHILITYLLHLRCVPAKLLTKISNGFIPADVAATLPSTWKKRNIHNSSKHQLNYSYGFTTSFFEVLFNFGRQGLSVL